MTVRAQNELWRAQNQRKTSPKEFWASDLEALEVSGTPRGDQRGFKEVCKSPLYHDLWNLSSEYEPSRSRWQPPNSPEGVSGEPK